MSIQGIRSNRGDAYQRSVALYWVVRMLLDNNISGVQVDVIATPDIDEHVYGDDIVVLFIDGHRDFIQAKVNQKDHQNWNLTDPVLKKELQAAKKQIIGSERSRFYFYSRTPFGVFQRLVEEAPLYSDFFVFDRESADKHKKAFLKLVNIWDEPDSLTAFDLVKRIGIGDHHSSQEWENYCLQLLQSSFSKPETALELIINFIERQHRKLGDPLYVICRNDVLSMLEHHGIYYALNFNEQLLVGKFSSFSLQGRQWIRTVGGDVLIRPELERLKDLIHDDVSSVLLEDVAGGGKTCILLDLIEYIEQQDNIVSLFIRGDLFASVNSLNDLVKHGLPGDFLAQTSHLANRIKVVVIIDSLDVLAVGRSHKSLQTFLGLIASLSKIPNITVIAASRSFDAKYDPLLREFTWSKRITLKPLSFDDDVSPLLSKRGINPHDIPVSLRSLLSIPQSLRLFLELIKKGMRLEEIKEHDLYTLYIQEVIEKDLNLGPDVVKELQNIAINLLKERSYEFPKNSIRLSSDQITRLLSEQVLSESSFHQIMFSHQTIADALRIQHAMHSKVSLEDFVLSQAQLPFIRPAVRAFIISLRNVQPKQLSKQIRQFLTAESVSMHLKRLAVETLAEMSVRADDLALVTLLSSKLPNLFGRFLDKAKSEEWFYLLHDKWLSTLSHTDIQNNAGLIFRYFSSSFDGHEDLVIKIWLRAIDEKWLNTGTLVWRISAELDRINGWNNQSIGELLEKLFNVNDGERDNIGKAICHYIEATGHGDELLWKFIIRDINLHNEIRRGRELKFNCQKYDLLNEHYLEKRLKVSDTFFSCVIDFLLHFSNINIPDEQRWLYETILLDSSSYARRHSQHSMLPHDSINELLNAVELAMKYRAQHNDSCWRKFEPILRQTADLGLRYLLCQSYLANLTDNVDGISYQLTDKKLLRYGRLEYELGVLANQSYPYLSPEIQKKHQQLLRHLYDDIDDEQGWREETIYERLIWIPCIYRLPELNAFFEENEKKYGRFLPGPSIHISGGWIQSPVAHEILIKLNHSWLVRLFKHYNDYNDWHESRHDGLFGGRDSLESALRIAASWHPIHFLPLANMINSSGLRRSYINAIIKGISTHLCCRFGNLNDSGWKPIEPLPDGEKLAHSLLDLVDRFCIGDEDGRTYSIAIEGCSSILTDDISIERLKFHFWKLGLYENPEPEKDNEERDLVGIGINSVRGSVVGALMTLCNSRLEQEHSITNELEQLLERYAKDHSMAVKATLLRQFPYFHYKNKETGWRLIKLLTHNCTSKLSEHLEQTLYYQYHSDFVSVKPYLDLIKSYNSQSCNEVWGRLGTLSFLSGHITEEELWKDICNNEDTKVGAGQVFIANLSSPRSSEACIDGLARVLNSHLPKSVFSKFAHSLSNEEDLRYIPLSMVHRFIENVPIEHLHDIDNIFDWAEYHVIRSPEEVLNIFETVIERLTELAEKESIHFYKQVSLVAALKSLLQEADMSDDSSFIDRVLSVQYWFLDHGVNELEELYDETV